MRKSIFNTKVAIKLAAVLSLFVASQASALMSYEGAPRGFTSSPSQTAGEPGITTCNYCLNTAVGGNGSAGGGFGTVQRAFAGNETSVAAASESQATQPSQGVQGTDTVPGK